MSLIERQREQIRHEQEAFRQGAHAAVEDMKVAIAELETAYPQECRQTDAYRRAVQVACERMEAAKGVQS